MATLNERLKELRINHGVSQVKISQIISLSSRNYQRYECGTHYPTSPILIALADYFDVSLDYLVGRSDDPSRK